ncbi:MAG: hypothetical protein ACT4P0_12235 [Panacagrimonas sp.]
MTYLLLRLVLIGLAIWYGVKLLRRLQGRFGESGSVVEWVRCARCGVHRPAPALATGNLCGKCRG